MKLKGRTKKLFKKHVIEFLETKNNGVRSEEICDYLNKVGFTRHGFTTMEVACRLKDKKTFDNVSFTKKNGYKYYFIEDC